MPDIQRYLNLVTSEHQDKSKFMSWLTSPLSIIDDFSVFAGSFYTNFDLDTATGIQLDIIGGLVGVNRTVNFQPTDGSSPVLNDDTFRLVIQARILFNQWDGTIPSLYDLWSVLFKNAYLVVNDNQNMTMNVFIIGLSQQIHKDLANHGYLIPKPQGVSISYSYSNNPLFGFGVESQDIKGFNEGTWSSNF